MGSYLVFGLGALSSVLFIIEFLGGPKLKERVHDTLLHWWDRIDDVKPPQLGFHEAQFALHLLQNLFGRSLMSWRRIWTSVAAILFVALLSFLAGGYMILLRCFEQSRSEDYLYLAERRFLHAVSLDWAAWFPQVFVLTLTAIAFTQWSLRVSTSLAMRTRFQAIVFLALLVGFVIVSETVTRPLALTITVLIARQITGDTTPLGHLADIFISESLDGLRAPLSDIWTRILEWMGAAIATADQGSMNPIIENVNVYPILFIGFLGVWSRVFVALAFLFWWLLGYCLLFVNLFLRRVLETEKGTLTLFAVMLTGLADLLRSYVK